jgi:precorrin-2 dehydrogenase/sirohydrochlorin ferrochelatase
VYPLCLHLSTRLCVVIGGGIVAERKVRGLLEAGASVRVVSPDITPGLVALVEQQVIIWWQKAYSRADLDGAMLVFAATDKPEVQEAVWRDAQAAQLLINVADAPERCDFQVPATLRRGDLSISVATQGKSPALAAFVKQRIERVVGEEYGLLTELAALLRVQILAEQRESEATKMLFAQLLHDDIILWIRNQQWERIQQHIKHVLGRPLGCALTSLLNKENA